MPSDLLATIRRSGPPLVACALAAGTLCWLAFEQGGYFENARLSAAVVLWAGLAAICLVELPRLRPSSPALVALAALALFLGWTALSTSWSLDPVRGERLVDLGFVYVAVFALGVLAVGNGRHARAVLFVALAVCVAVMAAALWARLHPGDFGSPTVSAPPPGFRMDWPLGYWNAVGGLGAMGGVLAVGFAADPRSPAPVRAFGAAAAVVCLVAAYLTFSRGSIAALAVGVVVLVLLGGHRTSLIASLVVIGAAVGLLVLRLEGVSALTTDPFAGEGQVAAGKSMTPVIAVSLAATAGIQALLAVGNRSVALADLVRRVGRPLARLAVAIVALSLIGAYVLRADAIEGRVAAAVEDTQSWLDVQWDEFNRPGLQAGTTRGSARLDNTSGTRSDLFDVALDGFGDAPLRGNGAGSYQVLFFQNREVDENVQNAHSLPLETMAELGLVGTGLLLAFLGAVVVALLRSRRRRLALPRTQTAAAGAAVAVWLTHAAVDWDWQMPAFTGLALLISATLFPSGTRVKRRRDRPAPVV